MGKLVLLVLIVISCSFSEPHDSSYSVEEELAAIITAECSVCDTYEQYLVGSTVLNRVDHKRWANTIKEVIAEPDQFHGYCSDSYFPITRTLKVARDLLKGKGRVYNIHYFYDPETSNQRLVKFWNESLVFSGKFHNYAE